MVFHNIFVKSKNSRKRFSPPFVIADVFEKNSLVISDLVSLGCVVDFKSLKVGDYICGGVVVERKSVNDFVSSFLNKRLFSQLKNLEKVGDSLLIIEGEDLFSHHSKINNNAVRGFVLSVLKKGSVPVLFTKDSFDTAKYLVVLCRQNQKNSSVSLHKKIPKSSYLKKRFVLESFEGVGPKKANDLIKRFKTLNNVFSADKRDLRKVLKGRTDDFIDFLND